MEYKSINDLKPNKHKTAREQKYAGGQSQARLGVISGRPIASLLLGLGFLSAVLLVTMFTFQGGAKSSGNVTNKPGNQVEETAPAQDQQEIIGVLTAIDTQAKEITLYDVVNQVSTIFRYTGATSITDKYDQQMAAGQLKIGTMLEGQYPKSRTRLTKLKISTKAWEYVGVNNLGINRSSKIMKIGGQKYKFTDNIVILDGKELIPVVNLAEQDELTVWGYDQTIWSITVTRGHGTVKLMDYDSFLGDFITIGYEAIQQIAKDMIITVREGNFNLTVENTDFTATKNITVYRNKETAVSLKDLGPDASKVGRITFNISPFGADLFVDGELTSYANPLELAYGKHDVVVSLGGYTTYEGNLNVDTAGKTIRISLPVITSKEEADVSETDTSGTGISGAGTPGTDTSGADTPSTPNTGTGSNDDNDQPEEDTSDSDNVSNDDFEEDEDHLIYIQNPLGASVYLNGEFMCTSPGSFPKLIGTHVLTFIKEGYQTMSYTVEVGDDGLDAFFNMPDLVKKK